MLERIVTFAAWCIVFTVWGFIAALFLIVSLPFIVAETVAGDR